MAEDYARGREIKSMVHCPAQKSPKRDVVILNAAAAIVAGGKAMDLKAGCAVARASIDSGRAKHKLELLIEHTNKS